MSASCQKQLEAQWCQTESSLLRSQPSVHVVVNARCLASSGFPCTQFELVFLDSLLAVLSFWLFQVLFCILKFGDLNLKLYEVSSCYYCVGLDTCRVAFLEGCVGCAKAVRNHYASRCRLSTAKV